MAPVNTLLEGIAVLTACLLLGLAVVGLLGVAAAEWHRRRERLRRESFIEESRRNSRDATPPGA